MIPLAPNSFKTFTFTKSSFSTKTRTLLPCASGFFNIIYSPKSMINASKSIGISFKVTSLGFLFFNPFAKINHTQTISTMAIRI